MVWPRQKVGRRIRHKPTASRIDAGDSFHVFDFTGLATLYDLNRLLKAQVKNKIIHRTHRNVIHPGKFRRLDSLLRIQRNLVLHKNMVAKFDYLFGQQKMSNRWANDMKNIRLFGLNQLSDSGALVQRLLFVMNKAIRCVDSIAPRNNMRGRIVANNH